MSSADPPEPPPPGSAPPGGPALGPRARLLCTGRPGSLDEAFFRWLMRGTPVWVHPVGVDKDVLRRLAEPEPGDAWTPGQPGLAGVVDRGAQPDEVLLRRSSAVEVLPYYEVESYLCHPALVLPALSSRGVDLPVRELMPALLEAARATYMPAVNAHLSHQARPSGRERLERMAQQYADQLRMADEILEEGNVEALLRYFPGRRLANRLCRELDFLSPQHMLEVMRQVPGLREEAGPLRELRVALLQRLGL